MSGPQLALLQMGAEVRIKPNRAYQRNSVISIRYDKVYISRIVDYSKADEFYVAVRAVCEAVKALPGSAQTEEVGVRDVDHCEADSDGADE